MLEVFCRTGRIMSMTDIVNYRNGDIVEQILDLTNVKGVDRVIMAGGGIEVMSQAITMVKSGCIVSNVNYFGSGDTLPEIN